METQATPGRTRIRYRDRPIILRWVTYDVYRKLVDDGRNEHVRMTYHDGVLEIMSPAYRHGRGSFHPGMVVCAYSAATGLECEAAGSTTFYRGIPDELKGHGKEPDESFYFRHLAHIRSRDELDLAIDPPPDLWIEVDNRGSSAGKLPVFAALGIAEVWRYRARRRSLWIGRLTNGVYTQVEESICLPGLTPAILLDLLDEARKLGQTAWDVWMRGWMAERAAYFAERRAALGV